MAFQDSEDAESTGTGTQFPLFRRSVLKAGVIASGAIGTATGRAVARRDETAGFRAGTTVFDGEDPDTDSAIVLAGLDVSIDDWVVYADETVAEQNPEYDPDGSVVLVAYEHLLEADWPDWKRARPDDLFEGVVQRSIKFHAFPEERLDRHRSNGK